MPWKPWCAATLQFSGAHKRRDRKENKYGRDAYGHGNQPAGHVPRPGPQRRIQPSQSQNRKNRSRHFVKQLFESAPEPPETARPGRYLCAREQSGHSIMLARIGNKMYCGRQEMG